MGETYEGNKNIIMLKNKKRARIWLLLVIAGTALVLVLLASVTIVIDPFLHYHKPLENLAYKLENERYVCDGIVRQYDYNAVITGSSMTENFKVSEFENLFGIPAVKVPYSGGYYNELDHLVRRALNSHNDVKIVVRSLDHDTLIQKKDAEHFEDDPNNPNYHAPAYLVNYNPFDDVRYFFNKTILLNYSIPVLEYTKSGGKTTTLEEFACWPDDIEYGADAVLPSYALNDESTEEQIITDEIKSTILENIKYNVTDTADMYPDTTFYLFFPPYSICNWDYLNSCASINYVIESERVVIEELLKHDNIKLFSFYTNYNMICNLNNYKDRGHYGPWINSEILRWMCNDEYLLTKDNYEQYLSEISDFYNNYDYSILDDMRTSLPEE